MVTNKKDKHYKGSPDQTQAKVDFATVLKRRRRGPWEHMQSLNINKPKELKEYFKQLRKVYTVTEEFEKACFDQLAKEAVLEVAAAVEKTKPKTPPTKKKTRKPRKKS